MEEVSEEEADQNPNAVDVVGGFEVDVVMSFFQEDGRVADKESE